MTSLTNITKPQSAFQYYLKNWKNLSDEEKAPFELMAQRDKNRYNDEVKLQEQEEENRVMKKEIYLKAYTGGYSASGLDNGARSYEVIGPVVKIVEYNEKWKDVYVKEYHYRDSNNIKYILYHNQQYEKTYPKPYGKPCYTYSKTYSRSRDRPFNPIKKFTVCENKPEYIGSYTVHYTSFDNNTWITYH